MKIKAEYIWLDGYEPEPNLRSKVKVLDIDTEYNKQTGKEYVTVELSKLPEWSFNVSSTQQAEGKFSDCILKPVRMVVNPFSTSELYSVLVMCEVMNPDGTPHDSNTRSLIGEEDEEVWFGFEQEYTIMKNGKPL